MLCSVYYFEGKFSLHILALRNIDVTKAHRGLEIIFTSGLFLHQTREGSGELYRLGW